MVLTLFLSVIVISLTIYEVWHPGQYSTGENKRKAPNFTLTDIEGDIFSLDDFRGKIVVLDFFYVECPYCDDEVVELEKIYSSHSREDLEIMSISIPEDSVEKLNEFRKGPNSFSNLEYEMNWIIARDTSGVRNLYNIQGYPTTVIIDKEGFISPNSPFIGLTSAEKLSSEINYLLSQ